MYTCALTKVDKVWGWWRSEGLTTPTDCFLANEDIGGGKEKRWWGRRVSETNSRRHARCCPTKFAWLPRPTKKETSMQESRNRIDTCALTPKWTIDPCMIDCVQHQILLVDILCNLPPFQHGRNRITGIVSDITWNGRRAPHTWTSTLYDIE